MLMSRKHKKKQKKQKSGNRLLSIQKEFSKAYDLHKKGETVRAEELYQQIIKKDPEHSDALHLLGVIALERNEYDKALDLINRAIRSYPNAATYFNNLGLTYRNKGLFEDAVKAYKKALEIDPGYAEAHNNLGSLLKDKGEITAAVECFERATRIDTGFSTAYYNLGTVLCDQGKTPAAIVAYQKALSINPGFARAYSNLLYTLHFSDSVSPDTVFSEHNEWAKAFAKPLEPLIAAHDNDPAPDRKLKVGYVSPDFCTHSVAFFLENVLISHNRNLVEIYCYSNTMTTDSTTDRLIGMADHWRDITGASDDEAAAIIRMDAIDILVDLAGHTRNSRMIIFALKPAPVQVSWLGYPDTTGIETMDYRLTDEVADPPGLTEHLYTESLYRIPGSFLCYKPSDQAQPVMDGPFKKNGRITFGSFNNTSKISQKTIVLWSRILKRVPDSRLKLKARSFSDFGTRKHILDMFADNGISSERIWFEGYSVTLNEHFLLYNTIDIALDTFPYHGTTTTCEALWMGVPVITLKGDTHVSKVGVSIMTTIGCQDLVANSPDDYVNKAALLAKDSVTLSMLRSQLRAMMVTSPIMDPTGFTQSLETGYRDMWRWWCEGKQKKFTKEPSTSTEQNQIYLKNLEILKVHHPHVESLLEQPASFNLELRYSDNGIPNLFIRNEAGEYTSIYPEDDPLKELSILEDKIRHLKGKTLCVMGAGLCIHAGKILDIIGHLNLIVLFEASPAIFKAGMGAYDMSTLLAHPNVRLAIGDSADPYEIINDERDRLFTNDLGEFIEYNSAVSLAPEWYNEKRKIFEHFFKRRKVSLNTVVFSGKKMFENCFRNLIALSESHPLDVLEGTLSGVPAVIVASGPSLSKNIHQLIHLRDKVLIIAADSALAPLMAQGILPHMIVSVDFNDYTFEKLAPFIDDLCNVDLVYVPNLTSKITNAIRFKSKYYTFTDTFSQSLFNRLLNREGKAPEDMQSVIHLAIVTAQTLGCDPIIFTGLDLAFSGTQDHATGTILNWDDNPPLVSSGIMVESIHGDMVPSSNGFISMIELCQRIIKIVPGRTYIDATEGGAKITGTKILSLADTIEHYCRQSNERVDIKQPHTGCTSLNFILSELKLLSNDLRQSLKQIKKYTQEQEHVEGYMKKKNGMDSLELTDNIKHSVQRMNEINTWLENDRTVFYVKSIMVESHERYRELELAVMESGSSEVQRFAAALKQQGFVQAIRKDGLEFLLNQVESTTTLIEMIINMDNGKALSDQYMFDNVGQLIERGYLLRTDIILNEMNTSPDKYFWLGCLHIKQGQIEKGKSFLNKGLVQDKGLLPKIEIFKETIANELLKEGAFAAYTKIGIDRVLELEPGNTMAIQLKEQWLIQRVTGLINNGRYETALNELIGESEQFNFKNSYLLAVFSYLLLSMGMEDKGVEYLKKSIEKERTDHRRLEFMTIYTAGLFGEETNLHDFHWVKRLVGYANSQTWARIAIQEIFWQNIGEITEKIMKGQISLTELEHVKYRLNIWKDIQGLIPEWYYLKSLTLLSLGEHKEAEIELNNAKNVERSSVGFIKGPWVLTYLSGVYLLYGEQFEKGSKIIIDCIESYHEVSLHAKLLISFVMIRKGHRDKVNDLFGTIDIEKSNEKWIGLIIEAFEKGDLIDEYDKYNNLKFISSYYLMIGKYCLKAGFIDKGIDYLRGAVNVDNKLLLTNEVQWIYGHLSHKWEDDCLRIESCLGNGDIKEAEKIAGEWQATKAVFENYDVVMSIIIEKKDGREKAVDYLQAHLSEQADNPEFLFHYSKVLFVKGDRDTAQRLLEKSSTIKPEYSSLWEVIGDVWAKENDFQKAINAYEKCITSFPGKMDVLRKIGDAYMAMGMLESASIAYQAVLNSNSENEIVKLRLQEILQSTKGT